MGAEYEASARARPEVPSAMQGVTAADQPVGTVVERAAAAAEEAADAAAEAEMEAEID